MKLYKFLNEDGTTPQGYGKWDLSGEWMPAIAGDLIPCHNGYHLLRASDIIHWIGPVLWRVEADTTDMVETEEKVVVRTARLVEKVETWNTKTMVMFACDCAERSLSTYESKYPNDKRVRNAIEAARYYGNGHISKELLAKYIEAARSARSAARSEAARSAEREWQTNKLWEYLNVLEGK